MNRIYVVTYAGFEPYSTEILGVYDAFEKANTAIDESCSSIDSIFFWIEEYELNKNNGYIKITTVNKHN